MKNTRFILIAATLLALLMFISCASAAGDNLLNNADFIHIGNDGLPEGWETDAYILEPGYTVFGIEEGDSEHPVAVSIQNIGENDARFAQTVEVEPDSLYLLSGYICAEGVKGGHGANLSVEGVYAFSEEFYDTEKEWKYIEYYGETGPDQEYLTVFARLGGYSGTSTGRACFAGLSLIKVDRVPGNGVADLWYKATSYDDDEYEEEDNSAPGAFTFQLLLIGMLYTVLALLIIWYENRRSKQQPGKIKVHPAFTISAILLSLILRIVISWFVEGYMVDVNCFLSWGHTMASYGPAGFYEATSFCDYPPLYTYVLALNSVVSGLFGNNAGAARVVFRLIPNLCDILGSWMLFRLLSKEDKQLRTSYLFLILALFNPAAILNSAAWGQMDSVLCLLLVCVTLYAVKGKWRTALPIYVVAVLVKPQALMLGPVGFAYIVITWIRCPISRRQIIQGTAISLIVFAAGVIPFSLQQDWDWLIQLYARTLASYPYATVNTANFYYLLGGNWNAVTGSAHVLAPVLLSLFSAGYGLWWYFRACGLRRRLTETLLSFAFTLLFILHACMGSSWAWTGGSAMAFAFLIVLSPAIRSAEIRLLPWLGGLLFVLLYVFGVKMHERYLFPALFLLAAAWILLRDRRILYVILLFTFTVFVNEGIVLDNSIRLGSQLGHLNRDNVWLADVLSILNVSGAVYAAWLNTEILVKGQPLPVKASAIRNPRDWKSDRKLHWSYKDTVLLSSVTAIYAVISLLTLGSVKAPQTGWSSSSPDEQIVFDLGEYREDTEILYFAQVSRNDFSFSASKDGENWETEIWAQMDQGQCWKWKYVTESYDTGSDTRTYYNSDENHIVRFSGRYIRLTAQQLGLRLNEILFRDQAGEVIQARIISRNHAAQDSELYSDPENLIDESDTLENLPSIPSSANDKDSKAQPSWWNSTYFDEIYHARTAYEFLKGTVPYETSHPPLGKILMSCAVAVFGMTPFGWRFAGALAGILMLPGMYLLGKQLTKKTWIALLSCLLMAFDCLHLTQTQIATIDSFPVLFIIFAYLFMLRFIQTDLIREKLRIPVVSLAFSGFFMGLSIASKWIGIYAGAGLAVLFFWHCIRMIRIQSAVNAGAGKTRDSENDIEMMCGRTQDSGSPDVVRKVIVLCCWCILFFVVVPVFIYLISYIPYMAYNSKRIHSLYDYIYEVWRAQIGMFNYHSTPNLGMDHPFYSPWWEWPVIGKPMYYASQQYLPSDNPVHHSIFAFGNPVIWFGGLAALMFCLFRTVYGRRYRLPDSDYNDYKWHISATSYDSRFVFMIVGLLAQYLPWVLVPRGTYIYHYFASLPFLMTAVCLSFECVESRFRRTGIILASVFVAVSFIFFILLFPYASGMNVSSAWLNIGRGMLRIWY